MTYSCVFKLPLIVTGAWCYRCLAPVTIHVTIEIYEQNFKNDRTFLYYCKRIFPCYNESIQIVPTRIISGIWPASFYRLTVNKSTMSDNG